jgi:signal transduction histidine kinase
MAAGALWRFRTRPIGGGPKDLLATSLAGGAILLGLLILAAVFLEISFHFVQVLSLRELAVRPREMLGEMGGGIGLDFILTGLALLMLDRETKEGLRPAQVLAVIAGAIALLGLIGNSYRLLTLYRAGSVTPMAPATAIGFAVLCVAILAARPDRGFMKVITSLTAGGALARRLLPMAVLIPWILGAIRLRGEEAGLFHAEFGVSSFAVSTIMVFTLLIWWNARQLYISDIERLRTERRLAVQYNAARVLADASDPAAALRQILQTVCETLGWQAGAAWMIDPAKNTAHCVESWHVPSETVAQFIESARRAVFKPGLGLPGRVWASAEPSWIADIIRDPLFERGQLARRAGLCCAVAFPVRLGHEVFGVIELFSVNVEHLDSTLLEAFAALGTQIGQFIERERAERELRQTTANLERSNTDLQQFAYVASHDLSEPLRMVISYLQLLRDHSQENLDAESREFVGFAIDGAARMQALIKDLLEYSRLDLHGRTFDPVSCETALAAAIANLKVAIEENQATITHDPLPEVLGDSVQLIQVFQNLLGNALKFRGAVPPHIHVAVRDKEPDWLFSVSDNGIGIDPKDFQRIFVIFQRLHTREEYPGTGMGLAICKRIVERHGGRMRVESKSGEGSAFFFTLPKIKRLPEEEQIDNRKGSKTAEPDPDLQTRP